MRDPFGLAAPVFIVVCLLKGDFFYWWRRKVSTYLPPLGGRCQELGRENARPSACSQRPEVLVSFPTRRHCGLVPFHNKNFRTACFCFTLIGALKASSEGRALGTLFARYTAISHDLPKEDALDKQQHLQQTRRRIDNMSQNTSSTNFPGTTGTSSSSTGSTTGNSGTGAATATGLAQTAQEYGEKISEAASQAKDYVSDKVTIVGDKLKELQNADLGEIAENAKDYARKNPGQAILISAAAGLLLGLIIRGRR